MLPFLILTSALAFDNVSIATNDSRLELEFSGFCLSYSLIEFRNTSNGPISLAYEVSEVTINQAPDPANPKGQVGENETPDITDTQRDYNSKLSKRLHVSFIAVFINLTAKLMRPNLPTNEQSHQLQFYSVKLPCEYQWTTVQSTLVSPAAIAVRVPFQRPSASSRQSLS